MKEPVGVASAIAHVDTYNRILDTLNQCFSIDKSFSDAVSHLKHLQKGAGGINLATQLDADGPILLATAHAFIELHLSAEDKKKAIGFHT